MTSRRERRARSGGRWHRVLAALVCVVGPAREGPARPHASLITALQTTTPPPAWMRGLWTREWIERKGVRTNAFSVHYLQTPGVFGDMRISVDRPAFAGARSFADLTDNDLRLLARQRGFTGPVTARGDTITWQHELDFQPPDPSVDIGRVERIGPGQMYEHALDSSYVESWRSLTSGDDAFLVVRVERKGRLDRMLLVAGDYFLYVRNREADLPPAESLDSLIQRTHASRAQVMAYLDCEFSTGRIHGDSVRWQIRQSTLPWREGHHLGFVDDISILAGSAALRVRVSSTERWSVPVNTMAREALGARFTP